MHRVNPKAFVEIALLKVCPGKEFDNGWSLENLVKDEVMNDDWEQHWGDQMFLASPRRGSSGFGRAAIDCLEFAASSDDICVWANGHDAFIWQMTPKELIKGFEELARIHYQMIKEDV